MNINFILQYDEIVFIKNNYKKRLYKEGARSPRR